LPETTLEVKRFSPDAADATLTQVLRGRKGRLTKADAVTASGLPTHLVDESLERLLGRYRSRLEVTDDGELLYSFDPALVRRDEPTLRERVAAAARIAARAGMWLFKAWIMVTLVVYVIAFLILLLAVMFGGNRRDDDRGWGGGNSLGWIWWFIMPDWRYGHSHHDRWGRSMQAPRSRAGGPKKKFIHSVFDFVFGPAQPPRDKLADEREALAYIRGRQGRITATDLVELFGWSYRQAEEEVTRLLVDYDGDPEVTDEGVIVYSFPKLLRSAGEGGEVVPWKPAWEKLESRPKLTGNSKGTDVLIGAFAGFNLIMSFFAAGWARMRFGLVGPEWDLLLTGFPLAFFGLFLAIPLARAGARVASDRRREARNQRRLAVRRVLEAGGAPLPAERGLEALLVPLEGEPEVAADGGMLVRFPRVAEERAALARHLKTIDVGAEKQIGKVIFGGDDDEVEKVRAELEAPDSPPRLRGR
jgi:hypothetical protein